MPKLAWDAGVKLRRTSCSRSDKFIRLGSLVNLVMVGVSGVVAMARDGLTSLVGAIRGKAVQFLVKSGQSGRQRF
ncbi:hypothetical protein D3C73_1645490 [compost metagenome]